MMDFSRRVGTIVQIPFGISDCGKLIRDWQIFACDGNGSTQVVTLISLNSFYLVEIATQFLRFQPQWIGYSNRTQGILETREHIYIQPYGTPPTRIIQPFAPNAQTPIGRISHSRRRQLSRGGSRR